MSKVLGVETGPGGGREATAYPPKTDRRSVSPAVALRSVSKRFKSRKGEVHAVDNVSLTIDAGEFVSILGPSGCGKSTLLNMIAGLLPTTEGAIEVLGRPVDGPVHDLGIVFQQHLLLGWRTILNNVLLQIEVRRLNKASYRARAERSSPASALASSPIAFPTSCRAA